MDIILELVDYYAADQAYASLMPIKLTAFDYIHGNNNTQATLRRSAWEYTPSTHLFYLEPTPAAYESIWDRDNMYRQFLTLFLVTW